MEIRDNVFLKDYTTLKLGGRAKYFVICKNERDIIEASGFADRVNLPIFPLGGGSNLIVGVNIPDAVFIKLESLGIEILDENDEKVRLKVYAGESWDDFVDFAVKKGFSGVEALSAIPGTVGATPVQNVGAYGCEVSQTIESVRGYNLTDKKFELIPKDKCDFRYRDSIFKKSLKNKFIIESIIFVLKKNSTFVPDYPKVKEVLNEVKKDFPKMSHVEQVRKTIQKIRAEKLPSPSEIPNVGSFFKNVSMDKNTFQKLIAEYPEMPNFVFGENIKIPSGWLIEKAGYKGVEKNGVGMYDKNALILVNTGAKNAEEILSFAREVQLAVKDKFLVNLEIEPEIISR